MPPRCVARTSLTALQPLEIFPTFFPYPFFTYLFFLNILKKSSLGHPSPACRPKQKAVLTKPGEVNFQNTGSAWGACHFCYWMRVCFHFLCVWARVEKWAFHARFPPGSLSKVISNLGVLTLCWRSRALVATTLHFSRALLKRCFDPGAFILFSKKLSSHPSSAQLFQNGFHKNLRQRRFVALTSLTATSIKLCYSDLFRACCAILFCWFYWSDVMGRLYSHVASIRKLPSWSSLGP